jgi:hypothetical protein
MDFNVLQRLESEGAENPLDSMFAIHFEMNRIKWLQRKVLHKLFENFTLAMS